VAEVSSQRIQDLRAQYEELRSSLDVDGLDAELKELEGKMAQPGFWDNQETAQEVVARLKSVKKDTDAFTNVGQKLDDLEVLLELVDEGGDADSEAELASELEGTEKALSQLQLRSYFTGPHDKLSAYVNIQAGAGGIDACDWAQMLLRLVTRYCERLGFAVELLESAADDTAGIKSATLHVKGRGAFGWLKSERGTHRLVRISPFDAQARRQTSFAALDITPEFDDTIEVEIKDSDLRVDTFSAGGPGGQHVNKTQSAIRITHNPTGIVVQCQNERHQHANRRTAMQMLKNRLHQLELEKREAEAAAGYATKSNMGFGAADRIRTYTMQPFTLVKDTRTGQEATDVNAVLDGAIDPFVEAYLRWAASGGKK
jgi:peptide chain release factor 2